MHIQGKNALITGGASGFGAALGKRLLEKGATIIILADINSQTGSTFVNSLNNSQKYTGKAVFLHVDVASPRDLENLFQEAIRVCGGKLDIIVNNAGIPESELFYTLTNDLLWKKVVDINFNAVIHGTRMGIAHFSKTSDNQRSQQRSESRGVILNISSMSAYYPMSLQPIYSATKAGVLSFTQSLTAFPLLPTSPKIRCCAICPSFSPTGIKPLTEYFYKSSQTMTDVLQTHGEEQKRALLDNIAREMEKLSVDIDMVVDAMIMGIENEELHAVGIRVTKEKGIDVPGLKGVKRSKL